MFVQLEFKDLAFNATFNNISVISCWSALLVEGTRLSWKNHRPVANHDTMNKYTAHAVYNEKI
jgi:hypothetical protein